MRRPCYESLRIWPSSPHGVFLSACKPTPFRSRVCRRAAFLSAADFILISILIAAASWPRLHRAAKSPRADGVGSCRRADSINAPRFEHADAGYHSRVIRSRCSLRARSPSSRETIKLLRGFSAFGHFPSCFPINDMRIFSEISCMTLLPVDVYEVLTLCKNHRTKFLIVLLISKINSTIRITLYLWMFPLCFIKKGTLLKMRKMCYNIVKIWIYVKRRKIFVYIRKKIWASRG